MENYWTVEDEHDVFRARTFEELCSIAMRIILRMPKPVGQVCGPISTGGSGSIPENLKVMAEAIQKLQGEGKNIFDQIPFEGPMELIKKLPHYKGGYHLLEAFYLPLFKGGFMQTLYFLPDWQSSQGATWEYMRAKEFGLEIVFL